VKSPLPTRSFLAACKEQNATLPEYMEYIKTELGDCNLKTAVKNDDSDIKNDQYCLNKILLNNI
jgi:hypothetical protein